MFSFTFNKKNSSDMKLKVKESNHLSIASKKVELITVPGRTGDLVVEEDSYENSIIDVICVLDTRKTNDFIDYRNEIKKWLKDTKGYKDLIFSDGVRFKAICINQIDISKILKNYGEVKITFSAYQEELQ